MTRPSRFLAAPWLLSAALFACSHDGPPQEGDAAAAGPGAVTSPSPEASPQKETAAVENHESKTPDRDLLLDPGRLREQAPDRFTVKMETTKGDVLIDVDRSWSPRGADRFYNLVKAGFYDGCYFFRVLEGFVAQVGLNGDPSIQRVWRTAAIPDDPRRPDISNVRGTVSFATAGPNTRTTQIFFNLGDNSRLDAMGFTPFGKVRDMAAIDALYSGYGEGAPAGRGPSQGRIQDEGNAYLEKEFPKLDRIVRATIVE